MLLAVTLPGPLDLRRQWVSLKTSKERGAVASRATRESIDEGGAQGGGGIRVGGKGPGNTADISRQKHRQVLALANERSSRRLI